MLGGPALWAREDRPPRWDLELEPDLLAMGAPTASADVVDEDRDRDPGGDVDLEGAGPAAGRPVD